MLHFGIRRNLNQFPDISGSSSPSISSGNQWKSWSSWRNSPNEKQKAGGCQRASLPAPHQSNRIFSAQTRMIWRSVCGNASAPLVGFHPGLKHPAQDHLQLEKNSSQNTKYIYMSAAYQCECAINVWKYMSANKLLPSTTDQLVWNELFPCNLPSVFCWPKVVCFSHVAVL